MEGATYKVEYISSKNLKKRYKNSEPLPINEKYRRLADDDDEETPEPEYPPLIDVEMEEPLGIDMGKYYDEAAEEIEKAFDSTNVITDEEDEGEVLEAEEVEAQEESQPMIEDEGVKTTIVRELVVNAKPPENIGKNLEVVIGYNQELLKKPTKFVPFNHPPCECGAKFTSLGNVCDHNCDNTNNITIWVKGPTDPVFHQNYFSCTVCLQRFSDLTSMRKHRDTHFKEFVDPNGTPYLIYCPNCSFSYTRNRARFFARHQKKCHGTQCGYCGCTLAAYAEAKYEHLETHMPSIFHECERCGNKTDNYNEHRKHLRTHSRFWECKFCEKKFNNMTDAVAHGMVHLAERPHECSDCGQTFFSAEGLAGHKRIKCQFCTSSFCKKMFIKNHLEKHPFSEPFICNFCDGKLLTAEGLINHLVLHY